MKKIISSILCLVLIFSVFAIVPFRFGAQEVEKNSSGIKSGDYEYKILEDGTAELEWLYRYSLDIVVPDSIDGYIITSIGNAFCELSQIRSIVLPNTIREIRDEAFERCESLESITIPNSVTRIGNEAFERCESLTSINIPDSVTSIGDYAFAYCVNLKSIDISKNVKNIGNDAFYCCISLSDINVDKENPNYSNLNGLLVNKEEDKLYYYPAQRADTSYTIPSTITSIGDYAFYGSNNLKSITIPNSVESIGKGAFRCCKGLTSITIPNKVTSISDFTFMDCNELSSVTFLNTITSVGYNAFEDTPWENNFLDDVIYIGQALYKCKVELPENTTYVVKKGTKSISPSAFRWQNNLVSITLPNSLISIGDYAFEGCRNLTSITIPKKVTSIAKGAIGYIDYGHENVENFTIYGIKGSEAERYAKDNDFIFIETQSKTNIGDANKDNVVNIADTTCIQMYLAKLIGDDEIDLESAAMNGDEVSIVDATHLQEYLAQIISEL